MEIFTDGSCINNGKNYAKAAYAIITPTKKISGRLRNCRYYFKDNKILYDDTVVIPCTNNRAELMAIILAIYKTQGDITIISDSELSINIFTKWMTGWFKNGYFGTDRKKNMDLVEIMYNISQNRNIIFIHQHSHTNENTKYSELNNEVDKLANIALKYENFKIQVENIL